MTFGNYIKLKRTQKEITLRSFCKELNYDASNWSKIERGVQKPPKDYLVYPRIVQILRLNRAETETMYRSAAISSIPDFLKSSIADLIIGEV